MTFRLIPPGEFLMGIDAKDADSTKRKLPPEAACLLAACEAACPIEPIREPAAAFLLRRLALIKVVPGRNSQAFALTEKGVAVLGRTRMQSRRTHGDRLD